MRHRRVLTIKEMENIMDIELDPGMVTLLTLAFSMLAGLVLSRAAKVFRLPAVTSYIVAGILIGPYVLGQFTGSFGLGFDLDANSTGKYEIICDVALAFIAFSIGNEFRLSALKKTGKQATVVAIVQAIMATVFVDIALIALTFIFKNEITIADAIILGAIATATAPAATIMVLRQYKAKGEVSGILLPIVALDDAVGLIVFAVSFGIAKSLVSGAAISIITVVVNPLIEVVGSLGLGFLLGIAFSWFEKHFNSNSKRLTLSLMFVIFAQAISMLEISIGDVKIAFSSLLVCMMLGSVFCNVCDFSEELMGRVDKWTSPLLLLFFVISGAELDLTVFANYVVVVIGIVYIVARSAGKIFGATVSSKATHCGKNVQKYLGITLLPQAGVALGMCMTAYSTLSAYGDAGGALIRNITLFAVLIYEILGPVLTKFALTKAGEIHPKTEYPSSPALDEEEEE